MAVSFQDRWQERYVYNWPLSSAISQGGGQDHQEARSFVKQGIKPAQVRRKIKQENISEENKKKDVRTKSFQYIALEWIEQQREAWSPAHNQAVLDTLQKNVFRSIGAQAVDTITPPDVLKILRKIEHRGSLEIARKVLQRMNAVFRYAIQTGRATYNPAADMQGVLKTKTVEHVNCGNNSQDTPISFCRGS